MGGERRAVPMVRLGDVLLGNPRNGYSPKAVAGWTGLQALGLGCLTVKGFAPIQLKNVPDTPLARAAVLADGDLLMSRANTRELVGLVGRYESTGRPCIYPDLMMRLRTDEDRCLSEYLEIVLRSARVRREVTAGARGTSESMVKIGAELVKGLEMPLPPVDEQRRIVAAHAAFERRIAGLERVRAKRVRLLQGLVDHLLSGLPGKRTSLGEASRSIDAGITLGSHRVPRKHTAGYLRVANVRKGWIDSADITRLEALERDRKRYGLQSGDVLVVEGHADPDQIARSAVVGPELEGLLYQNHLFRIRFDDVLPEFAMLWLNSATVRSYWRERCATSSGLYTINSRMLEQVPFPEAGLDQQQRVVSAWGAANESINTLGKQIEKLWTVQQAVVEDLLGGRVLDSAA